MLKEQMNNEQVEEEVKVTAEETEAFEKVINKEVLKAKIKHYGKFVAIGAGVGALGWLAMKALNSDDDIIEGVFEEIEIEE